MDEPKSNTIQVACPCCDATLTIDPALAAVLDHKAPAKPQVAVALKDAVRLVKEEASRRDEKYQKIAEAEKNKSKVLEAKFQELFKKAKEEPITKPLKDIDLD
jgi:thymidylate kinase